MKKLYSILLGAGVFFLVTLFYSGNSICAEQSQSEQTQKRLVLVLGSFKDYPVALSKASEVSQKLALPYSNRGMIFDKDRGLIFPDKFEDDVYAGQYVLRRHNNDCGDSLESCLTIEKSDSYQGMTPGYYILVGGIYDAEDKSAANAHLEKIKKSYPDAYFKKIAIYMGCMH